MRRTTSLLRQPRRLLAILTAIAMLSAAFAPGVGAQEDPIAGPGARLAEGLRSWVSVLSARGYAPELEARLPLIRRDVREVLDLPTLLSSELTPALGAAITENKDLGDLETAVDGAGAEGGPGSYELTIEDGDEPGTKNVDLTIDVTREVAIPVSYREVEYLDDAGNRLEPEDIAELDSDEVLAEDTVLELQGGANDGSIDVTVTARFATSFTFTDDGSGTPVPGGGLVVDELTDAFVQATGAPTAEDGLALAGRVGVTEVTASGSLTFDRRWELAAVDPDSTGGLSIADWQVSLPETVLPITTVDTEVPTVELDLELEAWQTEASPDGTVTWRVDDPLAEGAPAFPATTLGPDLAKFREVTPSDLLSGFTQLGALVATAEAVADVEVPFTDATVAGLVGARDVVLDAVQQQGAALVLCGRTDSSPPVGAELAGTTWYCQAYTQGDPKAGSISWSVADADADIVTTDFAGTIGVSPTANVAVKGVDTMPRVTVSWTDEGEKTDDTVLQANRRFTTFWELADALEDDLAATPGVDAATVEVAQLVGDAVPLSLSLTMDGIVVDAAFAAGNDLASASFQGIAPVPGAAKVTVGGVELAADLEVSLEERSYDPTNEPDRFHLTTIDRPLLRVGSVTSDVDASVPLTGRVGYLQATGTATGFDTSTTGDAAIEVRVLGETEEDDGPVALGQALKDPLARLAANHAITMAEGTVTVAAESADGNVLLPTAPAPSATVEWVDVRPRTTPTVNPDGTWTSRVAPFDVTPEVSGTVTAADETGVVLTDETADFTTAFGAGVSAGDVVVAQLFNATTQASCARFTITDEITLTCSTAVDEEPEAGLQGGTPRIDPVTGEPEQPAEGDPEGDDLGDDWQVGDRYAVSGDVTALGGIVAEGLVDVVKRLAQVEDAGLDESLPLVSLTPRQLLPQLDEVEALLSASIPRIAPDGGSDAARTALGYLHELEDELESVGDSVSVEMRDLTPVSGSQPVPHLVATVEATRSGTYDGADAPTPTLQATIPPADPSETGRDISFGTDADDAEAPAGSTPGAEWSSTVVLSIGVPIDGGFDPAELLVLDGTGVRDLTVTVDSQTLDLSGRLGSLAVQLGTGAVLQGTVEAVTGTHTGGPVIAGVTVSEIIDPDPGDGTDVTESTTEFVTADGLADVATGDVVVTSSGDWCSIDDIQGGGANPRTVTCAADLTGGAFAVGDTVDILQATEVTTADPIPDAVEAGRTLVHENGASCEIGATTETTITCVDPLAGGTGVPAWADGDGWSVSLSSPSVLHVPGAGFDRYGLREGVDVVRKLNPVGEPVASCTIGTVEADALTCVDVLSEDASWADGDTWEIGGVGEAGVRVGYALGGLTTAPLDVAEGTGGGFFDQVIGGIEPLVDGEDDPLDATCGSGSGLACLRLAALASPGTPDEAFVGFVEVTVAEGADPVTALSPAARDAVAAGMLDLSMLGTVLPFLPPVLEDALDGSEGDEELLLPLVGGDLGAGAQVVEAVYALGPALLDLDPANLTSLETQVVSGLGGAILPGGVAVSVATLTCDGAACTAETVLADVDEVEVAFTVSENLTDETVNPVYGCPVATDCAAAANGTVGFDSGMPALLIEPNPSEAVDLEATRGWRFPVTIGVDKTTGPYLDVAGSEDLVVAAAVTIPEVPQGELSSRCANQPGAMQESKDLFGVNVPEMDTHVDDYDTPAANPNTDLRCFDAGIGYLEGTFYDGATDLGPITDLAGTEAAEGALTERSRLDLRTAIDLDGTAGKLSVLQMIDRDETVVRDVEARGNVDLYVVTGRTTTQQGKIPSVHTSLHWAFTTDDGTGSALTSEVQYLDIVIDLRSFLDDLVGPWAGDALSYLSVLRPVADLLLTPIPGLTHVAEAMGNPPVTLFALIQETTGQDLSFVYALLQFLLFADQVTAGLSGSVNPDDGYAGLNGAAPDANCDNAGDNSPCGLSTEGGFKLAQEKGRESGPCGQAVVKGQKTKVTQDCTKRKRSHTISPENLGTKSVREEITQLKPCGGAGEKPCTNKEPVRSMSRQLGMNFSTPGLAFPFLTDPTEMYGMLLGDSDAELIRIDLGTLSVNFGLEYKWGPFMAGPVPISIGIGLGIDLELRAMLGIDTLGLRTTGVLGDGFFINDLDPLSIGSDGNARDVPELKLTFTVSLTAGISIGFFTAGVKGTIQFILGADLNDPNGDGRIRPAELLQFNGRPECALVLTGDLRVIISIFVELDFKFWSKEWVYDLFRRTWRLFELKCEPEAPALAEVVNGDVVLLAGSLAQRSKRNIEEDETDESFTVRVSDPAVAGEPRTVTVEAFGLVLDYELGAGKKIIADMGDGNDNLVLGDGADESGVEITFDIPTVVTLGDGNDSFEGGSGVDDVDGGVGDDTIVGGPGGDVLKGGDGVDSIDGGQGADAITGGLGDDRLTGAQDADTVDGGDGNDRIQGGPGMATSQARRIAELQLKAQGVDPVPAAVRDQLAAAVADGADVLIGGPGDDDISGHFGADRIVGSAVTGTVTNGSDLGTLCAAATGTDGADTIDGGPGDDVLAGGAGDDQMTGLRGDDQLCGGDGNDTLRGDGQDAPGTDGDDVLRGDAGDDILDGRGGDDTADGGVGDDTIDGGPGDDVLAGGAGTDLVLAGSGDDEIDGDEPIGQGAGAPVDGSIAVCEVAVSVEDGVVVLPGAYADPTVIRVAGHRYLPGAGLDLDRSGVIDELDVGLVGDVVVIDGAFDVDGNGVIDGADDNLLSLPVIVGSGDADCLRGGLGNDTARGGDGDDMILGDAGWDTLSGGVGADTIRGGDGADDIFGDGGNDQLFGDAGPDTVEGGDGDDTIHGGGAGDDLIGGPGTDHLYGEDGPDTLIGGSRGAPGTQDAGDFLYGGPSGDTLIGDNATVADAVDDLSAGGGGPGGGDLLVGGEASDSLYGGNGDDTLRGDGPDLQGDPAGDFLEGNSGNDILHGDEYDDVLVGGTSDGAVPGGDARSLADGSDTLHGGAGGDLLIGDNGNWDGTVLDLPASDDQQPAGAGGGDDLFGDDGADVLLGGRFDDGLAGGAGGDHLEGNHGVDTLHGGGGDDTILGGTSDDAVAGGDSRGLADGADIIDGADGADVIVGDNGTRDGEPHDLPLGGAETTADTGGGDTIHGGDGDDAIRAGVGNDVVWAGDGDDLVEGNTDDDQLHGEAGLDVLIGGTDEAGRTDGDDVVFGGDGDDVVLGDNARVDEDAIIELFDVLLADGDDPGDVSGSDALDGGAGHDRIHGQGGEDLIAGGEGDDRIEGNHGGDVIAGGSGEDDIAGGGSSSTGRMDDGRTGDGQLDGADTIHGDGTDAMTVETDDGPVVMTAEQFVVSWTAEDSAVVDGVDVIGGDNARIDRSGSTVLFDVEVFGGSVGADTSGGDTIFGGRADDRLYGQGGDDEIHGDVGEDIIEGNHGGDTIVGGLGDDDIAGGGSAGDGILDADRVGDGLLDGIDTIHGDEGVDIIGGDNVRIGRDSVTVLFDVQVDGGDRVGAGTSGGDTIFGGDADDELYGQGGDDTISGDGGDDVIEGNHGGDTIVGGRGDDDIAGGGSARDGVLGDDRVPSGLLDGHDTLVGDLDEEGGSTEDDGDDVVAGDNAWISRVSAEGDPLSKLEVPVPVPAMSIQQRRVVMDDEGPGATSGSDLLYGNGGQDDLYGQFDDTDDEAAEPFDAVCADREDSVTGVLGDFLCAGDGDDGLLGDQGTVVLRLAGDVGEQEDIAAAGNFVTARVFETGTLIRQVELTQDRLGGDDVLLGGVGNDAVHAGFGDDLADGGDGEDVLFGHDGDDALWGGADHDRLYGGFGADHLDVKPRESIGGVTDLDIWFDVAPDIDQDDDARTTNGIDILYGGEDADAMQADVASNGPGDGDRLLDWFGAYNINYVCASTNGAAVYSRGPAPATQGFLEVLATADGLVDVSDGGSAGNRSLALVSSGNKNPPHPDTPGNFTCEGGGRP